MAGRTQCTSKPGTLRTRPTSLRSALSTGRHRLHLCSSPAPVAPSMWGRRLAGSKSIPALCNAGKDQQEVNKEHLMPSIARSVAYAAFLACLFATAAHAQEVKAGDLVISQAWSRATPGGAKIAGGYLTIENKGSAPDRLIRGSGAIAGKV